MSGWKRISANGVDLIVYNVDSITEIVNDLLPIYNVSVPNAANISSITDSNSLMVAVTTANALLSVSNPYSCIKQCHDTIPSGGSFLFKDANDNIVATYPVIGTTEVYVTAVINGTSFYKIEQSSSYASYQAVIDANNLTKYCVGLKFKVLKGFGSGHIYNYPHILYIDEHSWMPAPGGYTSPNDLWKTTDKTGKIINNSSGYYFSSSIWVMEDTGTSQKLYEVYLRSFNHETPLYGAFDRFGVIDFINGPYNITGAVIDPEPEPEVEYMNELMNRFSPRYWAGSLGIYLIPTSQIADVMRAIMETDVSDLLKNIFFGSDGKEYIISLKWYYGMLQIQNYGHYNGNIKMSADRKKIKCGSVALDLDENPLYAHIASTEFATWTSSEIMVPEYFENYLDFMCSYQLYIPYYGFLELSPNDVVGGTLQLIYNINIVSGTADIVVVCKNSRSDNKRTKYYTVNAQIGIDIPYGSDMMKTSGANWAQTCGKVFVTGAKMGSFGATQEYMNFLGHNEAASNLLNDSSIKLDEGLDRGALKKELANEKTGASFKYAATQASNASDSLQNGVSSPSRSGSFSNESGSLDELHPYLLITRPVTAAPSDYEAYVGMPCSESVTLSNVTGFTQVAAVMPKTTYTGAPKYIPEIISLLQAGIYL